MSEIKMGDLRRKNKGRDEMAKLIEGSKLTLEEFKKNHPMAIIKDIYFNEDDKFIGYKMTVKY